MATITLIARDGSVRTVDESDFVGTDGHGYADAVTVFGTDFENRFHGEGMWTLVKHADGLHHGKSTTSNTIGLGSKSFSAETSLERRPWFVNAWAHIEDSNSASNWMEGEITSYDETTGALTVDVKETSGSGTIADWTITSMGRVGNLGLNGLSYPYTFDATTSESDPGSGNLRINNSDVSAATKLFIDDVNGDGNNVEAALLTFDDSDSTVKGHLTLVAFYDTSKFVSYRVDGLTDESGYVDLDVTHVAGSSTSPFSDGQDLVIGFTRTGDQGTAGDVTVAEDGTTVATRGEIDFRTGLDVTDDSGNDQVDVSLDTTSDLNVDHSGVNITAGTGLSGGGDITASRTINFDISTLAAASALDGTESLAVDQSGEARTTTEDMANFGFDFQEFTADGTWNKPAGANLVVVEVVGGGGGGMGTGSTGPVGGGGGGGYARLVIRASEVGGSETVTIGSGGAGGSASTGSPGGSTSFGSHVTANGGQGGKSTAGGGGDGTSDSNSASAVLGGLGGGMDGNPSNSGMGAHGGGGGGSDTSDGGDSRHGGAGGGGAGDTNDGVGGTSQLAGDGGNGNSGSSSAAGSGAQPGGGGGGSTNDGDGGGGGDGRVRVWTFA